MKKTTLLLVLISLFSFLRIAAQCDPPTNFVLGSDVYDSINITWDDNNNSNNYEIEFGLTGFIPTGITNFNTLSYHMMDSYDLNQFPQNEWLDIYFRTDCGSEFSEWVGPFTFYNYCSDTTINHFSVDENFNSFLPDCWNVANSGSPTNPPFSLGISNWEHGNFSNQGSLNAAKININNTPSDWLILPLLVGFHAIKNFQGNDNLTLNFEISLTQHNSTDHATLGLDDQIQLVLSPDFGETWYAIKTWDSNSSISNSGQTESIIIPAYNENYDLFVDSFLLAFWVSSGTDVDANVDFFVDNVYALPPATGSVNDFASKEFNYFPSPTKDVINFNANEIIEEFTLYNILGQEIMNKKVNLIDSQLNMSNLKKGVYLMKIKIGNTFGSVSIIKE